jgi:hypothetical protein
LQGRGLSRVTGYRSKIFLIVRQDSLVFAFLRWFCYLRQLIHERNDLTNE